MSKLGSAVGGQTSLGTRLAAGAREGGCQIGRSADAYALAQRPVSFGEDSPLRHPDLFYVGLSNVGGGTTSTQGDYAEFFLAQDRCRLGGGVLVAWSTVCQPVVLGGLGIHHFKHTDTTLLSK